MMALFYGAAAIASVASAVHLQCIGNMEAWQWAAISALAFVGKTLETIGEHNGKLLDANVGLASGFSWPLVRRLIHGWAAEQVR